jgi:hypothetical protein
MEHIEPGEAAHGAMYSKVVKIFICWQDID